MLSASGSFGGSAVFVGVVGGVPSDVLGDGSSGLGPGQGWCGGVVRVCKMWVGGWLAARSPCRGR